MTWDFFYIYAIIASLLLLTGGVTALLRTKRATLVAQCLTLGGVLIISAFIAVLWISLGRPPMRTMGETRLWYSLFVAIAGLITYRHWKYKWMLLFTGILATVFNIINIAKPELHDQSLMPALQSFWFIPHVTVYMFAYGILACSFILAIVGLVYKTNNYMKSIDNLVYIGTALLTIGMLMGAVWAKQAWGNFWTWDAKETWAAVTWFSYLMYIHLRLAGTHSKVLLYLMIIFSFLMLQMCWYGYQYLPSSQTSMHIYNSINQ